MTIGKVVDDFRRVLPEATVYVYDNNSSDGTGEIAREHGAVVRCERRQGKGNVVRQMMRDIDADYYLMVDGDDTYPAEAAPELLAPLVADEADMVVGDRLSNGTYGEENDRAFHGFGNDLVRVLIKWIYGLVVAGDEHGHAALLGHVLGARRPGLHVLRLLHVSLLDSRMHLSYPKDLPRASRRGAFRCESARGEASSRSPLPAGRQEAVAKRYDGGGGRPSGRW